MAHMLMASSSTKSLVHLTTTTTTVTTTPTTPKLKPHFHLLKLPHLPPPLKSLTTTALTTTLPLLLPHSSLAIEIEKAALFEFNLTLPIIMAEFLLLMWALDKVYFTPLGDFMDQRDASIKDKLADVKDTSSEVKELDEQANAIKRAARAEISSALNQMRKETQVVVEAKLAEGRKKVEGELLEALKNLEKQKEETIKGLDDQISALSDEIVKKVLPLS